MGSFGTYIRNRRQSLNARYSGYSIRAVARRMGIHHSFLSKIERGEADRLSRERIISLARELGEDPDVLMAVSGILSDEIRGIIARNPSGFIQAVRGLARSEEPQEAEDFYTRRLEARKTELEEITRRLRQEMKERKQAVKALEESEARHRAMFENNRTVQLLINPDSGDLIDANPAACAFYGYDRETMRGMNITDINGLTPREVRFAMGQAVMHNQTVFSFPHKTSDGRIIQVETRATPVPYYGRTVLHSIIIDVSARVQLEESLKRDSRIKDALARASQRLLGGAFTLEQMSRIILDKAKELTESHNAMVISLEKITGYAWGYADFHTSNQAVDPSARISRVSFIPDSEGKYPEPWCLALNRGKTFFINEQLERPPRVPVQEMNIPLQNFLTTPVEDREKERPAGLIAVANSIRSYTPADLNVLKDLAVLFSLCLYRINEERAGREKDQL